MSTALEVLCEHFACNASKLGERLRHPEEVKRAEKFLASCFGFETTYKSHGDRRSWRSPSGSPPARGSRWCRPRRKANREIQFHSLAGSASKLYAYQGFLGITVQQHYYARHRIYIKHPSLPCIVQVVGLGHEEYFPLELIRVTKPSEEETQVDELIRQLYAA